MDAMTAPCREERTRCAARPNARDAVDVPRGSPPGADVTIDLAALQGANEPTEGSLVAMTWVIAEGHLDYPRGGSPARSNRATCGDQRWRELSAGAGVVGLGCGSPIT